MVAMLQRSGANISYLMTHMFQKSGVWDTVGFVANQRGVDGGDDRRRHAEGDREAHAVERDELPQHQNANESRRLRREIETEGSAPRIIAADRLAEF